MARLEGFPDYQFVWANILNTNILTKIYSVINTHDTIILPGIVTNVLILLQANDLVSMYL